MPRTSAVLRSKDTTVFNYTVPSYTVAQASVITGVPQKQINQYLDRELKFLAAIGAGFRAVRVSGLALLRLNHDLSSTLTVDTRLLVIEQVMADPRIKYVSIPDGRVTVRADVSRSAVATGLAKWRQVKELVSSNNEVMSGEPCLKGTRASVYLVSDLFKSCGRDEALDTYPNLSERQIDAAVMYAEMFPRKGRPRSVGARLEKAKPNKRSRSVRVKLPT